jgi:acyl carrier protein
MATASSYAVYSADVDGAGMLRLEIASRIKEILEKELGVSPTLLADSNPTTPLLGRGLGLDSVEATALVAALEEEFAISIPDADLTAALFENVGVLSEYVFCKIQEKWATVRDD